MKTVNSPEDAKLQSLLRGARPAPALPPRFDENVWRRIEARDQQPTTHKPGWIMVLAGWLLKPKFALVLAGLVVVAGVGLGWNNAQRLIHAEAQARYLAAVAPNSLR